ncbi:MAG TPA: alpha/beta family hydrolase [Thermoanaerobaculia bacterium]|nr:alpha/beta family hydrolase [Thermoanaerobaculia bacterium]
MFLIDGPDEGPAFLFAHGAGAPMDTPFMNRIARGLAAEGIRVLRFEFPYMRARREGGRRGAPDRQAVLLDSWRDAVRQSKVDRPFVGGKSLGGRMASMIADEMRARGVICLGYPFHPPGRPDRLRTEHLRSIATPALILQGTRDPFGTPEEVATYGLAPNVTVAWLPDGDHSLAPRKASGLTEAANLATAVERIAAFILSRT